jgi:hypothetical protein
MPVIGIIYIRPGTSLVHKMAVGEIAMIEIDELAITKTAVYIHHDAEIVYLDEGETVEDFLEVEPGYISIRRIGAGLTGDDFELDFSNYESSEYVVLPSTPTYFEVNRNYYIVFADVTVRIARKREKEKTLDDLRNELEDALGEDDYDKAAKLRDQIHEREKSKKE